VFCGYLPGFDRHTGLSRIFNFATLAYSSNSRKLQACKSNMVNNNQWPTSKSHCQSLVIIRVTTCLENLEMSGNLKHVRDFVNCQGIVREMSQKKFCHRKVSEKHLIIPFISSLVRKSWLLCSLNVSVSFKNSAWLHISIVISSFIIIMK